MIEEWSLKLNDDRESYTLTTEDDAYRWILPNVKVSFDASGFPRCGSFQALPEESQSGQFTITIPDETEVSSFKKEG